MQKGTEMKKILILMLAIGVVACLVGVGSFAAFNDVETSIGNTFTSGDINLKLTGGVQNGDSVTATWKSPDNWAPGEEVSATLMMTNIGTVDAKHVRMDWAGLTHGSPNLMDEIIITTFAEVCNGTIYPSSGNEATDVAHACGNHDDILTLAEFVSTSWITVDDWTGDGITLEAGDHNDYGYEITFTFDANASNSYQGTSCSFGMVLTATQSTDMGGAIPLH